MYYVLTLTLTLLLTQREMFTFHAGIFKIFNLRVQRGDTEELGALFD